MLLINKFVKRFFDIFASAFFILLLTPLWLIVSIAIKCDSKGSIFFCQERLTKNGRVFKMYKFRSMVVNAEQQGAGIFNYSNDPRVTKVGKVLRSTSIDELPQLFNVFKGDLSLVGPRPPVTYELGDYDTLNKKYKKRFSVRGGITGLAQIRGRNENSWDEKVTLDNQYIDMFAKKGVWIDIKILFGTVGKVFKRKNICEEKIDNDLSDEDSAKLAAEEIIRIAHLPDENEVDSAIADSQLEVDFSDNIDEIAKLQEDVEIESDIFTENYVEDSGYIEKSEIISENSEEIQK